MSRAFSQEPLLLGGRLLPITSGIIFARASLDELVDLYKKQRKAAVVRTGASETFEDALRELLPLVMPHSRTTMLVPVATDGYIAIFNNSFRGYDAMNAQFLVGNGFDVVVVYESPNTIGTYPDNPWRGFYGHRAFTESRLKEPRPDGKGDVRGLRLRTESGRAWMLEGDPDYRPWSVQWDPNGRRNVDKFTHDHLVKSAANAGLRPFDEDFYLHREAIRLEATEPPYENQVWGTPEMAQGLEPRNLRNLINDPPPGDAPPKSRWRKLWR